MKKHKIKKKRKENKNIKNGKKYLKNRWPANH